MGSPDLKVGEVRSRPNNTSVSGMCVQCLNGEHEFIDEEIKPTHAKD